MVTSLQNLASDLLINIEVVCCVEAFEAELMKY